jgi:hypothetical protein
MKTFLEKIAAVCSLVGIVAWLKRHDERKARQAHWKQFDDTHHWDASADEWVRNDHQRTD